MYISSTSVSRGGGTLAVYWKDMTMVMLYVIFTPGLCALTCVFAVCLCYAHSACCVSCQT